jgi:hypothetical protein
MRAVPSKRPKARTAEHVNTAFIPLLGGEDLVSPALSINPGALTFSENYEPAIVYGYRRIDGFERADGRPRPSDASYWVLNFDAGSADFAVGDIITGGTSAATGEVLVVTVTSGTWGGGNAAGRLVLFNVSGTFQDNEAITAAGGAAVANGTASERGATNDTDDSTWLHAAIEATRTDIQAVPGSGRLLGVWLYGGVKYAFRNNAGGTAGVMFKSSTSGWTAVDLGRKLDFTSGGVTEIVEGNTITGAISGATALVKRVVVTSGDWAAGTAAGYFVFISQTGTFQAENLNVGASLNLATIAGNSAAQTLLPSGRYEFINKNFYGSTATRRMYGCDGVNKAFEFDGTVYCPITTGMVDDTPIHIGEHKKHLFLAFRKGSVQHAAPGEPLVWAVITGPSEIGTGDEITGFANVPGGVFVVFNRNQTYLLYGSSVADWDLKLHADESGAIEWSTQSIGAPRYLDDRGMTSLDAVQNFGDFAASTFSQKIQALLDARMRNSSVTASIRVRTKDQYRVFFADGTGVIAKFRPKAIEFTRINYGIAVRCACSVEDTTGREVLLFGSDDGYVYEMDAGTSFDGDEIVGYLRLPFGHLKSPQQNKHFFKAVLEIDAPGGTALDFTHELNYGNPDTPLGTTQSLNVQSGGGQWGSAVWSEFVWGAQVVGTAEGYIDGDGVNLGMLIRSASTYDRPHTINGVNIHYSMRGRAR